MNKPTGDTNTENEPEVSGDEAVDAEHGSQLEDNSQADIINTEDPG